MTGVRERSDPSGLVRLLLRDERVRYILTGAVGAAIFYSVFALGWFLSSGRPSYVALVLISNLPVAIFTFRIYRDGVFRSNTPLVPGFMRFYVICISSVVGSLTIVPLLVEVAHVPIPIAPVIFLVLQPFVFYPVNKFWVFRERRQRARYDSS